MCGVVGVFDLKVNNFDLKTEVLKLWAVECKDLINSLENIGKIKTKNKSQNTGI